MPTSYRRSSLQMGTIRRAVNTLLQVVTALPPLFSLTFMSPTVAQSPMDRPIKIVAFGDSLTAGYNLSPDQAFPIVLGKALQAKGYKVELINAGVSGDTTSGGRDRLDWVVPADAEGVILELGANDALRGVDPAVTRRNLEAITKELVGRGHQLLLAGMVAPRSMGEPYTKAFDAIYPDLATRYGLLFYPLFIAKTALDPKLSLPDGLHPNAKGVEAIVNDILPKVEELIGRIKARQLATHKN